MKTEVFQVKETHINATENYTIGENSLPVKESKVKTLKDLYKYGIKNFGKCISKAYINKKDSSQVHIGYVFQKLTQYEDTKEKYLSETWLTLEHYIETRERKYLPIE